MTVEIGQPAPDAPFLRGDGTPSRINAFRGRSLVLYFYPKNDTSGCTREAQAFTALIDDFTAAGAVVLGISKDSAASHQKFTAKYGLKVHLGSDDADLLCNAFGVWVEKSMYGRKYMGIERATFLIDAEGIVRAVWRKVKVSGHAQIVLEAVLALS